MLTSLDSGNGPNVFLGEQIESLRPDGGTLADKWILRLKDGSEFHIAPDCRGLEVYVGLYRPPRDPSIHELPPELKC